MTDENPEQPKISFSLPKHDVVDSDPWSDDTLVRRAITSRLDEYVINLAASGCPAAIALDGQYGTGKTFILERWVTEKKMQRGDAVVYYNAWENDCDDDPLLSLLN